MDENSISISHPEISQETPPSVSPEDQPNPPVFTGEVISLTGTLASMTHEEAYAQIEHFGGQSTHHVTRSTTMLVIGEEGWPLEPDGKPSIKLQQAEALIHEGVGLRIVRESEWLQMMQLTKLDSNVQQLYTPAMLSQILKIPVQVIRGWERAGLIRAEKRVFRLPYFSYQEVVAARRLSELIHAGATETQLTRSLSVLGKYLDQSGRIFEQLEMLASNQRLVVKDDHGYLEPLTRQRVFDFSHQASEQKPEEKVAPEVVPQQEPHLLPFQVENTGTKTSTDWMVEGCRRAEMGDTAAAIKAFRQALRKRPNDAEAHFYLADSLYRLGRPDAALERYLMSIEQDAEYLEAWVQIGCIYAEMHKYTESIEAFDAALQIHPTYAEAHFQKGETLFQMHLAQKAIPHWKAYLEQDRRGPWAELAYERLDRLGIEVDS